MRNIWHDAGGWSRRYAAHDAVGCGPWVSLRSTHGYYCPAPMGPLPDELCLDALDADD